ncbi:15500_t:CDS:2, partial [Gigaspora rosea]
MPLNFPPWKPSNALKQLLIEFETKILYDHPHIPCCYCSILMFRSSSQWVLYNLNEDYTLPIAFPNIPVHLRHFNNKPTKIAICNSWRTPGSNPYTTYRFLKADFYLSKNIHVLELYSGMIGAFLNSSEPSRWYHETLPVASDWLKRYNPIFQQYQSLSHINSPLPTNPSPIPLP